MSLPRWGSKMTVVPILVAFLALPWIALWGSQEPCHEADFLPVSREAALEPTHSHLRGLGDGSAPSGDLTSVLPQPNPTVTTQQRLSQTPDPQKL